MKIETFKRAKDLTEAIDSLKEHLELFRKHSHNRAFFEKIDAHKKSGNGSPAWGSSPSAQFGIGQSLRNYNGTLQLLDEFLGDWDELMEFYQMRLLKRIETLEKEFSQL